MMNMFLLSLGLVGGLVIGAEGWLRLRFGLGTPLTYVAHDTIGYLLSPGQEVRRFGNRIRINQYSMRGNEIAVTPDPATLRILMLGDSIVNGGWWTAQERTLSALLEAVLTRPLAPVAPEARFAPPGSTKQPVEVLNASANSWGPRNELAYIEAFGTFHAQLLILVINTDDLFATAPTAVQVGRDRNYPAHRPGSALQEVITRYLVRPTSIPELEAVRAEGGDRVGKNLAAIGQIRDRIHADQGEFLLAMTPLLREVAPASPRDYEQQARQRLVALTQAEAIPYVDFLPVFNAQPQPQDLYRDHIHLSAAGNQLVVQHLVAVLEEASYLPGLSP
ncbi:MAG: SGNH/GDSL hydrolase family protein [Synechococcales bacterium]|nr:SGNH/GDSL hydrolase family protein [Synechococcales bacterium]